ncbi:uncharacterized protein LOC134331776 [Trichomycterus rosablanca]|uniref:uncharacterized protein LOC134331776 n=1 Tax=Trichomycterus rosablanca TaxID=2290929 RepID=UPI002F3518CC
MASECSNTHTTEKEEQQEQQDAGEEFDRLLQQIGGRQNVYLVGDAEGESTGELFQEFIVDMFDTRVEIKFHSHTSSSNGDSKSAGTQSCPRSCPDSANVDKQAAELKVTTVRQNGHSGHRSRTIHCSVIIFIFRHSFIHNKAKRVCMEEILRDVQVRMKKARGVRQAVLGLVRADAENSETRESVVLLMETLRSVFIKRSRDSVWAGHFIPKAPESVRNIKRNVCSAVQASQNSDNHPSRKRRVLWPPHRWFSRGRRDGRPGTGANSPTQKAGTEEGIPLQSRSEPQS